MGLAITRGLLAAEGGRVWAENHPDGGAVFTIAVPVESQIAGRARRGKSVTRPVQILLVDDEVSIQRAMAPLLRSRGYHGHRRGQRPRGIGFVRARAPRSGDSRSRPPGYGRQRGLPAKFASAPTRRSSFCRRAAKRRTRSPPWIKAPMTTSRNRSGPEELMARVRAALRRSLGREGPLHGQLTRGDLTIDFDRRRVHRGELEIRLSPKEFELLTLWLPMPAGS